MILKKKGIKLYVYKFIFHYKFGIKNEEQNNLFQIVIKCEREVFVNGFWRRIDRYSFLEITTNKIYVKLF